MCKKYVTETTQFFIDVKDWSAVIGAALATTFAAEDAVFEVLGAVGHDPGAAAATC